MSEPHTPDPVDVHVGSRIRLARSLKKMNQETLAGAIGVTFQQVQKYEKGVNRVSASMLWHVARALNTNLAWFFEGLDDGAPRQDPDERRVRDFAATPEGYGLLATAVQVRPEVLRAHTDLMKLTV